MPNVSQEVQYQFRTRVARGTLVARCFRGRTPGHRRALPQAAKWPRTDIDAILNSVDATSRQGQWRWDGSIRVCFSIRSILINEIISEYLPALIGSFRRKALPDAVLPRSDFRPVLEAKALTPHGNTAASVFRRLRPANS